jgi:hypothetical protein
MQSRIHSDTQMTQTFFRALTKLSILTILTAGRQADLTAHYASELWTKMVRSILVGPVSILCCSVLDSILPKGGAILNIYRAPSDLFRQKTIHIPCLEV